NAVEEAANEAIAFEPAVVALTGVRVVGDRVLVGVLFADEAGKEMLDSLGQGGGDQGTDEDQPVQPTKIEIWRGAAPVDTGRGRRRYSRAHGRGPWHTGA